jgi:hypothetical protein
VEKYGTARQATDDNRTQRMRVACWILTVTETHSQFPRIVKRKIRHSYDVKTARARTHDRTKKYRLYSVCDLI